MPETPAAPAAPAEGQVAAQGGDLPAQMGSHGAIHMNTPAPVAPPAPVATPAPAAPAGDPGSEGITPIPDTGSAKFYDDKTGAYNWEAHAKEAEFKLSQKGTGTEPITEQNAEQVLASANLDWDVLRDTIVSTGTVTEADFKALEGIGLPREITQEYIDLSKAHIARRVDEVTEGLGGDMSAVVAWAMENLTSDERDQYDTMLNSENWKPAAQALRAQMGMAPVHTQGTQIQTPNAASPGGGNEPAFADQVELNAAIADKKYRTDPVYRAAVMRRASKSTYAHSGNTGSHKAGL